MAETFTPWTSVPASGYGTNPSGIYKEVRQVGKGTYGEVYLGQNKLTNATVALKKVSWRHNEEKYHNRGFPLNALREIRLLKIKCSHPNLVRLLDVAAHIPSASGKSPKKSSGGGSNTRKNEWEGEDDGEQRGGFVYLVFEYVEHDLAGIIDAFREKGQTFSLGAVKSLIKQLLEALVYIHGQNICHRDLKCSNMLITRNYQLKLADFGLARELNNEGVLSPKVVTLWYRAPELLLGDQRYTVSVDVWSVGCILIELLRMSPLFPGKEELDQLKRIFLVCGSPNSANWPSCTELPLAKNLSKLDALPRSAVPYAEANGIEQFCAMKSLDPEAGRLADRLLALDPARRCSAEQALQMNFLLDAPPPTSLPPFESDTSFHEWETKKQRKAAEQKVRDAAAGSEAAQAGGMPNPAKAPGGPDAAKVDGAAADKPREREEKGKKDKKHRKRRDRSPGAGPAGDEGRDRKRRRSSSPKRHDKKDRKSKKKSSNRSRSPRKRA